MSKVFNIRLNACLSGCAAVASLTSDDRLMKDWSTAGAVPSRPAGLWNGGLSDKSRNRPFKALLLPCVLERTEPIPGFCRCTSVKRHIIIAANAFMQKHLASWTAACRSTTEGPVYDYPGSKAATKPSTSYVGAGAAFGISTTMYRQGVTG